MLTAIDQSVEISTLKTSACLPIQIRIRRSTSGQTVRLRNAMASASQTSAVDRRCWRALPRYVICAPMLIGPSCEAAQPLGVPCRRKGTWEWAHCEQFHCLANGLQGATNCSVGLASAGLQWTTPLLMD